MRLRDFDAASGRIVWAELHGSIRDGNLYAPAFEVDEPQEHSTGETHPEPIRQEVNECQYDQCAWRLGIDGLSRPEDCRLNALVVVYKYRQERPYRAERKSCLRSL